MENSQSYVTYTSSCETAETSINMSVNPNNSNLIITKVDSETKQPIENVSFRISNEKNEIIGEYTTNEKGVIELKNIKQGVINIKEISTVEGYILNENEVQLELNWGETKKITLENEKKKGSLKIVKVDKDNNEIKLDEVEFELYNENDELIQTFVTDQNGEIEVNNLEIGNYKLKETKTKENYVLNDEEIDVIIEYDKETLIEITNSQKELPKLPRTGF
jgi:uncharacterized surface anchored protein